MTRPLATLRSRQLLREVRELEALRASHGDAASRRAYQLDRLNALWAEARSTVPHWRDAARFVPARFDSLEEYVSVVPETTRALVQDEGMRLADPRRAPDTWRMTGGSTSRPIRLPAWKSEFRASRADTWMGRSWYGVRPDDPLFMLWGHAHLLGGGVLGTVRAAQRKISDRLLGYMRFSAYDLRPEAMRRAGEALLAFAPRWIVGYSVALDSFAAANLDRREQFHRLGLRVAIATAESFPSPRAAQRLADLLGCPVAMEYGSVETGVLAHTQPPGGYGVLWHRYLLDTVRGEQGRRVLVTSLFPRCTPLFRYDMGDEVDLGPAEPPVAPEHLQAVLGRCNDFVDLADGTRVHSELFSHAVRPCAEVRAFQVVRSPNDLRLHVVVEKPLSEETRAGIRGRLARIHPALAAIEVVPVETLQQTAAGKTRMVVRVAGSGD